MINNKFSNEKCICCAESQWSILGPLLLRTLSNHTAILPKLRGPEISRFLPCMLQFLLNNLCWLSTLARLWKELGCLVQNTGLLFKKKFPNMLSNTFLDFISDMGVADHRHHRK